MPGRLFLTQPLAGLAQGIGATSVSVNDPPRRNIQPGQDIAVLTRELAFQHMRWGLIPVGRTNARGRPVMETIVNARSETVFEKSAFQGVGRAVVPADGWYEWTGKKGRKTAWRISSATGEALWFAGICDAWTAPGGREIWQVATVTCEPNADVRDIHDRMGVLLRPQDIRLWLEGTEAQALDLACPAPSGSLTVEAAEDVDWRGP
ncbi:MAG: SOS response-associated peptidase [Pseudomonadota bacterium]